MSFYSELGKWNHERISRIIESSGAVEVERALRCDTLGVEDLCALLSPAAADYLEEMASRAQDITLRHFGKSVELFTPLYLSNFCVNGCTYCGFSATNEIERGRLELNEVEREAESIASTGLRHVLLLTGESPAESPVEYIAGCIRRIRDLFDSISVEIYPVDEDGYRQLVDAGCDGLTIFQEVYDEALYAQYHPRGPKRDFRYRLDAPERGCRASLRTVNIGALLGLGSWRSESFLTGVHAAWLQRNYPGVSIGLSLPRMRPHAGSFVPAHSVSDRELVQIMCAMRIFLPRVSITISTREREWMRDNCAGIGMTRMSAGVSTGVGGRTIAEKSSGQFDISDARSVDEICAMLTQKGFQPVLKDWMRV